VTIQLGCDFSLVHKSRTESILSQTPIPNTTTRTENKWNRTGIGSLWVRTGVTGARSINCPYLGKKATAEFRNLTGCKSVKAPTETDFDRNGGTFCTHWDEDCMGSELMTGVLDSTINPLSRITIAGLEDLGYTVDYSKADPFTVYDLNFNCQCSYGKGRQRLRSTHTEHVHQFGTLSKQSSRRQRRRLSDEAYQTAMEYGLNILSQRSEAMSSNLVSVVTTEKDTAASLNQTMDATKYVGDQIISILVEENGEIYGVMVVNDATMP
jgi:hypothetical protein